MRTKPDPFRLTRGMVGRCWGHYAQLNWRDRTALAFSSVLGLVLLFVLSPVLLPLALWMLLTRKPHAEEAPPPLLRSYR